MFYDPYIISFNNWTSVESKFSVGRVQSEKRMFLKTENCTPQGFLQKSCSNTQRSTSKKELDSLLSSTLEVGSWKFILFHDSSSYITSWAILGGILNVHKLPVSGILSGRRSGRQSGKHSGFNVYALYNTKKKRRPAFLARRRKSSLPVHNRKICE
jgi:hypothetical protein